MFFNGITVKIVFTKRQFVRLFCDMKKIIFLNALIPLLMGIVLYMLFSNDVIALSFIGIKHGLVNYEYLNDHAILLCIYKAIRFYFLDMLWAYSLSFTLILVTIDKNIKDYYILIIAVLFSVLMEVFQLTNFSPGTFDFLDIIFEVIIEFIAIIINRKFFKEASE